MSDDQLRALWRRLQETGALDDEVAWIQGMLRAGRFDAGRVEYLARLGHPAAGRVTGHPADTPREWSRFPAPVVARARVALALVSPLSDEAFLNGERRLRQEVMDGYYDDVRTVTLDAAEQPLMLQAQARVVDALRRWVLQEAKGAAPTAGIVLRPMTSGGGDGVLTQRLLAFLDAPSMDFEPFVAHALEYFHSAERFRERVCEQVAPWVLGTGDPVR